MFALLPLALVVALALVAKRGGARASDTVDAGGPELELDAGIPDAVAHATVRALHVETDAARLLGFANALGPFYPRAADAVRNRAAALKG